MIMIMFEFTLAHAKFSYVQCFLLQLIIFQIGFDHKATDTVAGIASEQDIQRSLKDITDNKIEFLENQSRRNNIRVDRIPEDDH